MIIKEIKIKAFGGLKDKVISLKSGMNLIYGENEKGKSTIENFIKLWLYGVPSKGGRDLRKKYSPFSGEVMAGELIIEHDNREYEIRRTFGKTKRGDTLEVIDLLSGEDIKNKMQKEVGEFFLGVNERTFSKTLFIPQLGVEVKKEKDEEIKDKLQEIFGSGTGEVSASTGIENLSKKKKELKTTRGTGEIDKLNLELDSLQREKAEIYKAIDLNLDNESLLLKEKKENKVLKEEIEKLEIYKKYIKKKNLKKEYEDIFKYLKRGEEIKKEEELLNKDLIVGEFNLDTDYLDNIEKIYNNYNILEEKISEKEEHIRVLKEELEEEIKNFKEYEFFNSLDLGIKEKLIKLNAEQESLKEKKDRYDKLLESINKEEEKIQVKERFLGDVLKLKPHVEEIKELLKEYEHNLISLKKEYEKEEGLKDNTNKSGNSKIYIISAIVGLLGLGVNTFIGKNLIIYIVFLIILLVSIGLYIMNSKKDNVEENCGNEINELKENIDFIENKFKDFIELSNVKNKENLIRSIKLLEDFIQFENKTNFAIEERLNLIEELNIENEKERYNQNEKILDSVIKMSSSNNIDEVYIKIDKYEKIRLLKETLKQKKSLLESEIENIKNEKENLKEELLLQLKKGNLENIDISNLKNYIEEIRNKLLKKKELESALENIQETYNTLLKDRDIEDIKEEFSKIGDNFEESNYKKEEDIEAELKNKSNKLIESEKKIKFLEGEIKLSLAGKRDINIVEEEILEATEKIEKLEKNYKAINIAIEVLENADRKIKEKFGPTLNENIKEVFSKLTDNKYGDVILKEDYDLLVRDEESLFSSEYLSNGSRDQLYLSLRLALIKFLFKDKEVPIIFDEVFLQYDDIRRERGIKLISEENLSQTIIFTCQRIEEDIIDKNNIKCKKIYI